MNSFERFKYVYIQIETMFGRLPTLLDIERAYKRYITVTGEEPKP